jgi:hypothetical protein
MLGVSTLKYEYTPDGKKKKKKWLGSDHLPFTRRKTSDFLKYEKSGVVVFNATFNTITHNL